jgi:signal transduction histidine kinase
MPGEINCIFTKALIPFVEKEVGADAGTAIVREAGHPREWLIADHNWIPLALADRLVRLAMQLMGETDEERWARRYGEYFMDWKPSREERSYLGTYSMGIGHPRRLFQRLRDIYAQQERFVQLDIVRVGRGDAVYRWTLRPGYQMPRWVCAWLKVQFERFPTNWRLPRAQIVESQCAARGADACVWHVRWRNPSLGVRFWAPVTAGVAAAGGAALALAFAPALRGPVEVGVVLLPVLLGALLGQALLDRHRRRHTERLLDLQSEEIIYSNNQLERKFADLETRIEQLSLLTDLSTAMSATLDVEDVYEQALLRLVDRMGYHGAYLFLVDRARRLVRGHKAAEGPARPAALEGLEFSLDDPQCAPVRVVLTGRPLVVNDVERTEEPLYLEVARAFDVRAFAMVPIRLKDHPFGVLAVTAREAGRFEHTDADLLAAVANHVAIAVDRAASFRTIEELSRGLEDKVRVRTEQLRTTNEELRAAYRDLQTTQLQLIQQEKMASVGQLVAGVAHELNNPIGFVSSNVSTLESFVHRLRAMLETYESAALPQAERARVDARRRELQVDYALKYLDSMIEGIREGAERTRKIVRDLRVFARTSDEVWGPVDLHEELESSLTLLNHLLKDRVTVRRAYGVLGPVECVRSQVDQVFLNVLANAAQAIRGPGEIRIETSLDGGMAVVTIRDTGAGIASADLGRVFDPFFTTKPVGEGTGLGLSISYEIMKKHRGEIRVESPPGGGAVFTLRLPLTRAPR